MSDLDFDLNAPAAPSLTLDAAPAAPTLTLDPEADAKVVEEAKKATPVTVEDTPLSPEEQKMVQDFAEKIDLTNSQMILQYGAASQKKLSDFSDSALSRVRTKDMGETGELITQLIGELKGFDATAENQKGFLGFFKKKSNELEALKVKYDKADVNVERIKAQLEDHQVTLMKDIAMLDKMYQLNLVYFKELSMYILAGRKKLQQVRENDLAAAEAKAKASGLPEDAQAARDLADQCDRFEKKLYDLELTRNISIQMGPQIRLIQSNDTMMAAKIQKISLPTAGCAFPLCLPLCRDAVLCTDGWGAAAAVRRVPLERPMRLRSRFSSCSSSWTKDPAWPRSLIPSTRITAPLASMVVDLGGWLNAPHFGQKSSVS